MTHSDFITELGLVGMVAAIFFGCIYLYLEYLVHGFSGTSE